MLSGLPYCSTDEGLAYISFQDFKGRDALYNKEFYFSNTSVGLADGVEAVTGSTGCKLKSGG